MFYGVIMILNDCIRYTAADLKIIIRLHVIFISCNVVFRGKKYSYLMSHRQDEVISASSSYYGSVMTALNTIAFVFILFYSGYNIMISIINFMY